MMHKGRIEAFSDGVFAVIITIMVLELKVPHGPDLADLAALVPVFLSYVLSFIYVGIYWCNHHHLLQASHKVRGATLWANLHLLFWLSLIPFVTAWAGENHFSKYPVALYGFILFMCGAAYTILVKLLVGDHGKNSVLERAMGEDVKGKISVSLYLLAILISFWMPEVSCLIYIAVAIMWLVPDSRIESHMKDAQSRP